ncbi:MAG: hypothetical protein ABJB11_24775 [Ferruginibacter sp.]
MKIDKNYVEFIQSIKKQIVQSRYAAARFANREQLMLYFKTGVMISEKIKAQNGGQKYSTKFRQICKNHCRA